MVQPLWKKVWKFLNKLNIELPYDSAIPLLGIYPRNESVGSHKNLHANVQRSIDNGQKIEIIQISINLWIDTKMNRHTMDYYSAIRRNEVLIYAEVWMNLENMLSGRTSTVLIVSQTQSIIWFIWNVQNRQIPLDRKQISGCPGLGLQIRGCQGMGSDCQWI